MRKVIAALVIVGMLFGVLACTPMALPSALPWTSIVYGYEGENDVTIEGNIMAVFYLTEDEQVLFWVANAQIVDNGDGTWDVTALAGSISSASGVNQAMVDYGLYQYQEIEWEYEEVDGTPAELPIYLEDLDLQEITADDLPHSEHIGKLTAVDTGLAKPATVTRRYMGVNYDIQCFVTQAVADMWVADELNVGDYVLVSFIEESPNGVEKHVAIVTDKVYKSW